MPVDIKYQPFYLEIMYVIFELIFIEKYGFSAQFYTVNYKQRIVIHIFDIKSTSSLAVKEFITILKFL